jgi:hypothetical protein
MAASALANSVSQLLETSGQLAEPMLKPTGMPRPTLAWQSWARKRAFT